MPAPTPTFDYKGFIQNARTKGVPDSATFKYLSDKGLLPNNPGGTAKPPAPKSFDIPSVNTGNPKIDIPSNIGIGTANFAKNVAGGFASDVMQAGYGAADLATKVAGKAAGAVGLPGVQKNINQYAKDREANNPITKASAGVTNTIGGKVGEVAGEGALFAAPGGIITKGQKLAEGANIIRKAPWIVRKMAQVVPEMIGTGGVEYIKSGGDKAKAEGAAVTAGVLSTLTHVAYDGFTKLVPQSVKENVAGFLKFTGKQDLKGIATGSKVADATKALTTMVRNSDGINVTDMNGTTKAWDPKNTNIVEVPQVLYQVKDKIYKAYTALAKKAGDEKALFQQPDFDALKKSLGKFRGKGFSDAEASQAAKWEAAINRYATKNPKDPEGFYFKGTSPENIQKLLETVNKHANPHKNDTAVALVANDLATTLRESLDKKITSGVGGQYKDLRLAYSQLKGVEKDIIERSKVALRKSGMLPSDFIDGLGSIDILQGVLTGNPAVAGRGVAILAVKSFFKYIRDPEVKMRKAFRILSEGEDAQTPGPMSQRFLGAQAPVKVK